MTAFIDPGREAPQDWPAIGRWLHGQGLDLDRGSVRQFASGVANLNYLVTVGGRRAVLRRPPAGPVPPGAYDLARQHLVMSRLPARFAPTPRSLAYCADPAVIGVPFIVVEHRDGIPIGRTLPEALRGVPDAGGRLSRLMVDTLAELHDVAPASAGLQDLGKPAGFAARQVQGWARRASLVLDGEAMRQVEAVTQWLAAHLPAERPATILHLDFKLDNVLVDPATLTVGAVVDWEMSTLGDPVFDLALMLTSWGEPGDHEPYCRMACMPCDAPGWWSRRRAVDTYLERRNLALGADELKFFWLLALLRQFVALAQLVALYRRESMPNASGEDLDGLMRLGLAHARGLVDQPLDW